MPTCPSCGVTSPSSVGVACPRCGAAFPNQGAENAAEFFIPKNSLALAAYYISLGSILTGALLGIPAIVLGILGIKRANKFPASRGKAHAWVGIILGTLTTLATVALFALIFLAANR
jgi:hypothetical protein